MDRDAWHTAVHGFCKESDMTEWLNWTELTPFPTPTPKLLKSEVSGIPTLQNAERNNMNSTVPTYNSITSEHVYQEGKWERHFQTNKNWKKLSLAELH